MSLFQNTGSLKTREKLTIGNTRQQIITLSAGFISVLDVTENRYKITFLSLSSLGNLEFVMDVILDLLQTGRVV